MSHPAHPIDIEEIIQELLEGILAKLGTQYNRISIEEKEENGEKDFHINVESDDPGILIGKRGEHIHAIQQLLKSLAFHKLPEETFHIHLDIDNYRERQEANVLELMNRKVENARRTGRAQVLPPMSGYFRRVIHLKCTEEDFDDIITESQGEGEKRQVIIKLKN